MRAHPNRGTRFQRTRDFFLAKASQRRTRLPLFEPLEQRSLLAADLRSIDGGDNNLAHPDWGSTGVQLLRFAPADYADGISTPGGQDRPSAREISNALAAQTEEDVLNDRNLSAMAYALGQFLDHDIDLTEAASPVEDISVLVPAGDPYFDPTGTGTQTIPMSRSDYDPTTGTSIDNPRQQMTSVTAFIDGSQVYGSSEERTAALRTFSGGHLITSDGGLLPYNTAGLPNENESPLPDDSLFLAGDVRVNDNIELTAVQTLFVREHNRLADALAADHPDWSDEQLFQEARKLVIAEIQMIAFNEFLPALLGSGAIGPYRGYDPNVNPGIATEFSTAAFRLGHSMLGNDVEFLDNVGEDVFDEVPLRSAFFNPGLLSETGIDSILKYLASDPAQEIDNQVVDEVRNFLFGQPGAGGFDLASLNIQRGRDHGLADYNSTRVAYGLKPAESFADITSDPQLQQELADLYGSVDNIDLWVGGLAEDHVPGASVGPLFRAILTDQFERLRDGDRFWYQRDLPKSEMQMVRGTTLADVIRRNTTTTNLQDNVFYFYNTVQGQVFFDADANGRRDRGERGVGGVTVELVDADGNLIATSLTASNGSYAFEDLDLGVYHVQLVLPDNMQQTTRDPRPADLTRAEDLPSILVGVTSDSNTGGDPNGHDPNGPGPGRHHRGRAPSGGMARHR